MGIIIRFISGFIVAPPYVSGIAMSSQLFGDNYVSMYSGLLFFSGNLFVFISQYVQAYIYDEYNDWRSVYFFTGLFSIFIAVIFLVFTIYEYLYEYKPNKIDGLLYDRSEISLQPSTDYNSFETTAKKEVEVEAGTETEVDLNKDSITFWRFLVYRHRGIDDGMREKNIKEKMWNSLKLTVRNKYNYYLGIQAFSAFVIIFAMNGLWVIEYCILKYGISRETASIISGIFFMGTAMGSLVFGKLGQIYPRRIVLLAITVLLMSVGTLSFIYVTDRNTNVFILMFLSGINGFGSGASTPIHYSMVREYNNYYNCEDTATGFVNVQRTSSGFLAQLLMGIMIDIHWMQRGGNDFDEDNDDSTGDREYTVADYNFAFLLCTVSVGLAFILLFILKETYGKNVTYEEDK